MTAGFSNITGVLGQTAQELDAISQQHGHELAGQLVEGPRVEALVDDVGPVPRTVLSPAMSWA